MPIEMPPAFNGFMPPYPLRILSVDEVQVLIALTRMPEESKRELEEKLKNTANFAILTDRLAIHSVPVDFDARAFLSSLDGCFLGYMVVLAWTLAKIHSVLKQPITLEYLCKHEFAEGVPRSDEKTFEPVWVSQKVDQWKNGVDLAPWPK